MKRILPAPPPAAQLPRQCSRKLPGSPTNFHLADMCRLRNGASSAPAPNAISSSDKRSDLYFQCTELHRIVRSVQRYEKHTFASVGSTSDRNKVSTSFGCNRV
jgi:hypothetical protein